jgi:sigma-E factor negative regulatory protein RseC
LITETGRVLEVEGDWAWVACRRQVECARCAEGRGCGGGVLGRLLGDRLHKVRAATGSVAVAAGDQVLIGLGEDVVMRAAAVVYLVPLLLALAGALAAWQVWWRRRPRGRARRGSGFRAGAALGPALQPWPRRRRAFQPVILRRADGSGCMGDSR